MLWLPEAFSLVVAMAIRYVKLLPGTRVNAADPGYTKTDSNGDDGAHTVAEGADAIVELVSVDADGSTGSFLDRDGTIDW